MKTLALKLLIKCLISYLGVVSQQKDERMTDFLAGAWMSPGFRTYIAYREGRTIFELAGGSGMTERGRNEYIRLTGQRLENLMLGLAAKNAHTQSERVRKAKLSTPTPNPYVPTSGV